MRTFAIFLALLASASAFSVPRRSVALIGRPSILRSSEENSANDSPLTLEEKMKSWEATDEEKRAATLGGLTPGAVDGRLDAGHLSNATTRPNPPSFDMGLARFRYRSRDRISVHRWDVRAFHFFPYVCPWPGGKRRAASDCLIGDVSRKGGGRAGTYGGFGPALKAQRSDSKSPESRMPQG